jgi:phenylpropionate dioxygenase-like ring-hydroxylating dioxygenase large terminal subunit
MAIELEGERGSFVEDATHSWMLPSRYYTDPAVQEREVAAIFKHSWIKVGHVCDLQKAGDYLTETIAGQPVMAVRGRDGEVRGFYNVCQHRGHELLKGRGNVKVGITCPYHAWLYEFDGTLKNARLTDDVPDFDKSMFGLRPLPLAIAGGLVFINLASAAEPFETGYDGFDATIREHLDGIDNYTRIASMEYDIAADWKVVVDNFSEGYHIPVAHPRLATLYNTAAGSAVHGPLYSHFRNSGHASYQGMRLGENEPYLGWTVWPNLCMLSLPGSKNLIALRMDPDGGGRCHERVDVYGEADPDRPENVKELLKLFAEIFNQEDIALVESVQRGLASDGFDQGRYIADRGNSWFSESGLHLFHSRVLKAIGALPS